jgi:hypothetical protein
MPPCGLDYGRHPDDQLSTILWRAFDKNQPERTVVQGRIFGVSLLVDPEHTVRSNVRDVYPAVWENVEEWRQLEMPPVSQICGRLFCPKSAFHRHRVWAPGDLCALVRFDPTLNGGLRDYWPFPLWGTLVVPGPDDPEDGILVEVRGRRSSFDPEEIRRLRPDEIRTA